MSLFEIEVLSLVAAIVCVLAIFRHRAKKKRAGSAKDS
jgi:hypothetical protein